LEQRAQLKKDKIDCTINLNIAVQQAQEKIITFIDGIAQDFNQSSELITEKLHLGGHALKQQRNAGINNAYVHCLAQSGKECMCIILLVTYIVLTELQGLTTEQKLRYEALLKKHRRTAGTSR
jgi:hypothetical protein